MLSGGAYLWWAQELAPEQRSSGSPPRGPAYRSGIDERSAAGVAPNAAEHSWRQSLELGVDLLSPALNIRIACYQEALNIGAWLGRIKELPGWAHPYDLMPGHPLTR